MGNYSRFDSSKLSTGETKTGSFDLFSYLLGDHIPHTSISSVPAECCALTKLGLLCRLWAHFIVCTVCILGIRAITQCNSACYCENQASGELDLRNDATTLKVVQGF